MSCDHGIDAGAYVLGALEDDEAGAFAVHLRDCERCRLEVAALRAAADTLPVGVARVVPPPQLRDRIMREVSAEASLLRAAGPEADAPPPVRRRRRLPAFPARRAVALAGACALVGAGVVTGLVAAGGEDTPGTRTLSAKATPPGARAALHVTGDRAELAVRGMPTPRAGRIYQVWYVRDDGRPRPTRTLFSVPRDGQTTVELSEPTDGVREILVSDEPAAGSTSPTTTPVITATNA